MLIVADVRQGDDRGARRLRRPRRQLDPAHHLRHDQAVQASARCRSPRAPRSRPRTRARSPSTRRPSCSLAIKAKNFGPYADKALGDLPVNFIADLDITGGNSGSPALNGKGELVGLAFDGNIEGVASNVVFNYETTRTILVDIRYMMWVMDAIDGADNVLRPMTPRSARS
jgi:hypothetical protein